MAITRRTVLVAIAATAASTAIPAHAESAISVSLWSKGTGTQMPTGLGHAMGGDMSKATMGITANPASAPAGVVTFNAKNDAKNMVHEMVVAPLKSPDEVLPYSPDEDRVDEDAAIHLGEVEELNPGSSGKLSITLKPGTYILYCNIPGHYMAGMWTLFEVK